MDICLLLADHSMQFLQIIRGDAVGFLSDHQFYLFYRQFLLKIYFQDEIDDLSLYLPTCLLVQKKVNQHKLLLPLCLAVLCQQKSEALDVIVEQVYA